MVHYIYVSIELVDDPGQNLKVRQLPCIFVCAKNLLGGFLDEIKGNALTMQNQLGESS